MSTPSKSRARRAEIRKNRPDLRWLDWKTLRTNRVLGSVGIALVFAILASSILTMRQNVIPHRDGQWVPHDIVSRVEFSYTPPNRLEEKRRERREEVPRIYRHTTDIWGEVEKTLLELPDLAAGPESAIPIELRKALDTGALANLREAAQPAANREIYAKKVNAFVQGIRQHRELRGEVKWEIFLLPEEKLSIAEAREPIEISGRGVIDRDLTYTSSSPRFEQLLTTLADQHFKVTLAPHIVEVVIAKAKPTHIYDEIATAEAKNRAALTVTREDARELYPKGRILVAGDKGKFDDQDIQLLRAENEAYLAALGDDTLKPRIGLLAIVFVVTAVMGIYVYSFQRRIVRNYARIAAIAGLFLAMLLLAQVAGIGTGPLHFFGVAPTLLAATILTIAYDRRFALGLASLHGLLVTVALNESIGFFIILWVGVLTTCFLLDDVRTRSKLIEVSGAAAIAMMIVTAAVGAVNMDPWRFILNECLYTGGAGFAVGFVALGILPTIERAFRITTSMTLLELADVSKPLLRRLSIEAPGTYSHSLQVAILAEAAAEAIGANALLCRVGAYYHDVGKINKADYFIENQQNGENRHLNLSPSVSLLIIVGHVKDGLELAKEYNLPTSIPQFIQQHHGTTLVEYFYHQACTKNVDPQCPTPPETQYRYPGPKPKSRETAIVMIADAVESAARALPEPTASRVENLIHELVLRRLMDGQFDDCELTMRDLAQIERAMMKTLLGMYHGRIAYPSLIGSTPAETTPAPQPAQARPA